jgi:hypothetical protein
MKKKGRWKGLKLSVSQQLEEAWTQVQHVASIGGEPHYRKKIGEMEVNRLRLLTYLSYYLSECLIE